MATYTATYNAGNNRFDLHITNSGNNLILPIGGRNGKKELIFKRTPEGIEPPSLELERDCQYHMHMDSMKDCKAGEILKLPAAHITLIEMDMYPLVIDESASPFSGSDFTGRK